MLETKEPLIIKEGQATFKIITNGQIDKLSNTPIHYAEKLDDDGTWKDYSCMMIPGNNNTLKKNTRLNHIERLLNEYKEAQSKKELSRPINRDYESLDGRNFTMILNNHLKNICKSNNISISPLLNKLLREHLENEGLL